jgi:hypothetical protein
MCRTRWSSEEVYGAEENQDSQEETFAMCAHKVR